MNISWIKMSVSMFDDDKIKIIETLPNGYEYIVIWVKILCMAGKKNDNGCVYLVKELPLDEAMLARVAGHNVDIFKAAIAIFESFGMVTFYEGQMQLTNWVKYQDKLKSYDDVLTQNAIRQKNYRDKQKEKAEKLGIGNQQVTPSRYESRHVTLQEEERERERERKIEGEKEENLPSSFFEISKPIEINNNDMAQKMENLLRSKLRNEMDEILSSDLDFPTLAKMFTDYWIHEKQRSFDPKSWKGITTSFMAWIKIADKKEVPVKELTQGVNANPIMERIIARLERSKRMKITNEEAGEVRKFISHSGISDEELLEATDSFCDGSWNDWKGWIRVCVNTQERMRQERAIQAKRDKLSKSQK